MEITEKGLYAAFGIEPPADGGKGQEIADPVQEPEGVQVQEVAAPETVVTDPVVTEGTDPGTETGFVDDDEPGDPTGDDKPPLTVEERRANAARRREQEKQEAIDKALAEDRAKNAAALAGILKNMGLKDPGSGQPVETLEQLRAFQRSQQNVALQQKIKDGELTPDDIASVVSSVMQDQQAQSAQQTQPVQQPQDTEAAQATARQRINDELHQIMEMDKSVKSIGDLLTVPEIREKVSRGYSLLDAFTLVRGPKLEQAKQDAAKQAAMNNLRGKSHMAAVGSPRGPGAVSVPRDEMAMYRLFNPGATDAQIQAHYNKNRK